MLNLFRSILFGFVLLGTGLAAQGVDLQRLLQNDPDLQKQIDALNLGNSQRNDTFGVPTSQPPQVLNSNDLRGNPALIFQSEVQSSQGQSVLSQYFSILTGQALRVYGADEFRQTQDETYIFQHDRAGLPACCWRCIACHLEGVRRGGSDRADWA